MKNVKKMLFDGAMENNINKVRWALNLGADITSRDRLKRSPLHYATSRGSLELVKFLIDVGADVNAKDFMDILPLHNTRNIEMVRLLVEYGADLSVKEGVSDFPILNNFIDCSDNLEIFKFLIPLGIDVNASDSDGYTTLHRIADSNCNLSRLVDIMVLHGADINAKNKFGETPLHIAVKRENAILVKSIYKSGADTTIEDNKGLMPYFVKDNSRIRRILIQRRK